MEEIENVIENEKTIEKPKKKGQSKERMMELHKIRSQKADERRKEKEELKLKQEEIEKIKKEKIEFEYEEAKKIKEAIDKKRNPKVVKEKVVKENKIEKKNLYNEYNEVSREILRNKFHDELKRRVMADLFS